MGSCCAGVSTFWVVERVAVGLATAVAPSRDAHLSDDTTVAKMGHPDLWHAHLSDDTTVAKMGHPDLWHAHLSDDTAVAKMGHPDLFRIGAGTRMWQVLLAVGGFGSVFAEVVAV